MPKVFNIPKNAKITQLLDPAVLSADVNCASVDMQGYSSVVFLVLFGESGDTLSGSVYVEGEIEESIDDSTFTDVADADVENSITGTNTGTFVKVDAAAEDDTHAVGEYRGNVRYARPVLNFTGTHTNGIPVGVIAIQMGSDVV